MKLEELEALLELVEAKIDAKNSGDDHEAFRYSQLEEDFIKNFISEEPAVDEEVQPCRDKINQYNHEELTQEIAKLEVDNGSK